MTRVNTDLVAYPRGLSLLRAYEKARLSHVVLRANVVESQLFLAWLLAHSDASELEEIRLYPAQYAGLQQTLAASTPSYSSNYVDLTSGSDLFFRGANDRTTFEDFLQWQAPSYRWDTSFRRAPRLRTLEFSHVLPASGSYETLFAPLANSLETLDLAFLGDNAAAADASRAIAKLKKLRVLRLRRAGADYLYQHECHFDLNSETLEIVDLTKTSKIFGLRSVEAPRLRELHVADDLYGNGLRRVDPADPTKLRISEIRTHYGDDMGGRPPIATLSVPAAGNLWYDKCLVCSGGVSSYTSEKPLDLPTTNHLQCHVIFHSLF